MHRRRTLWVVLAATLLAPASASAVDDVLVNLDDGSGFSAVGVGSDGQVAGTVTPGNGVGAQPAVWRDGTVTVLPLPPGMLGAAAVAVAPDGAVLGNGGMQAGGRRVVRWVKGQPALLPALDPSAQFPSAELTAVNANGVLVGWGVLGSGSTGKAVGWSSSGSGPLVPIESPVIFGGRAIDVADTGAVLGWQYLAGGDSRRGVWNTVPGLPSVALSSGFAAEAFGEGEELFGTAYPGPPLALHWTRAGGVETLPVPVDAQETGLHDANAEGDAVGWFVDADGVSHAALWRDGAWRDLDALRPDTPEWDGWTLAEARAISDHGWIIGIAQTPVPLNRQLRSFLLRGADLPPLAMEPAPFEPPLPPPPPDPVPPAPSPPDPPPTVPPPLPPVVVPVVPPAPTPPAVGPSAVAAVKPAAPRLAGSATRLVVRGGVASIAVSCPAAATAGCQGRVALVARPRPGAAAAQAVGLGSVAVTVRRGRSTAARVSLTRAARTALRQGPLRATVRTLRVGGVVVQARQVTLVLPV